MAKDLTLDIWLSLLQEFYLVDLLEVSSEDCLLVDGFYLLSTQLSNVALGLATTLRQDITSVDSRFLVSGVVQRP